MLSPATLQAFGAELEKQGIASSERRYNRAYYQRNRSKILAKNRDYRRKNQFKIKKQQKIYARKVKSGQIRPRRRIHTGTSYSYTGVR